MDLHDIETKLAAARTRLILDKPFLGALALRLPVIAADPAWCQTTSTDARSFYYNPAYIDALSMEQAQFVLANQALHCALSHFSRRQHRNRFRWDIACDHAINPLLVKDGLRPPPGTLVLECFEGMTAEEIYPCIAENNSDEPEEQPRHEGDGRGDTQEEAQGQKPDDAASNDVKGAPRPQPLNASEQEALSAQWQQRLAGAAQQAQQAGKLGGILGRMVGELMQPKLPWRLLLARYMTQYARDDYSYMRPSRREGAMILPSLRSAQADILVALDTSGSISEQEIDEFMSEINAIKGQLRARIVLHACDAALDVNGPWLFEPWDEFRLPGDIQGGGGTDFRPVFEWVARQGREPDLLLYFTDAAGGFPPLEPAFPVLWLVKGSAPVPWGQRIQLN
ncbi:MAG: VWA-like domain-containing protein [Gallionella sp.]|nr:VWA-like domain-containing protein [Gallionella sp.]MDP1941036.1 VWA-like domain-containing protein [Gallionella sp.]